MNLSIFTSEPDSFEEFSRYELIDIDVSFLEGYYPPSIKLIPEKYRKLTEDLLMENANVMENIEIFENFTVHESLSNDK